MLQLWHSMQYFMLANCLLGVNAFCIYSYQVSVGWSWCFIQDFRIVLFDQIFHTGGATYV